MTVPTDRTVTITPEQVELLQAVNLQCAQAAALRDHVVAAIVRGHGIKNVLHVTLTGDQLTVTEPVNATAANGGQ